jgi:uncharacterized protein (DUF302 family)
MTLRNRHSLLAALAVVALTLWARCGSAEELLMVRSAHSFPEAMLALQESISEHGYKVSRVQRVDIGLTRSGFQTDKYRVIFFGKPDEIRRLTTEYPQLIPYLPMKMTIFAEEEQTLVVAADPVLLEALVSEPSDRVLFERWKSDIQSIMDDLREEEG